MGISAINKCSDYIPVDYWYIMLYNINWRKKYGTKRKYAEK